MILGIVVYLLLNKNNSIFDRKYIDMNTFYFSYFFSYWIFVWFLFYEFKWTFYNPYLWLCIAFVINFFITFLMIYYRNDAINVFTFLILNLVIKGFPILLLSNYRFQWKDIYAGLGLFGIYLLYLEWNDKLLYSKNIYYELYQTIQKNKPIPFMVFIKHWM